MLVIKIKFVDLFAGVGGFHYGLQKASEEFECVFANEWDRYAVKVYRERFSNTPVFSGDIREVDYSQIPDHDLLCGGFPCQAFSIAGKRRG